MQLLSPLLHSTYLRRESPFTLACKPRSAIWELGVFFWRLVRIEAVACWNNKQVNILTMHNSLSLGHLNVLKIYSSSGQKTSSRLCPGRVETQRQTWHDDERDVSRKLKFGISGFTHMLQLFYLFSIHPHQCVWKEQLQYNTQHDRTFTLVYRGGYKFSEVTSCLSHMTTTPGNWDLR